MEVKLNLPELPVGLPAGTYTFTVRKVWLDEQGDLQLDLHAALEVERHVHRASCHGVIGELLCGYEKQRTPRRRWLRRRE